MTSYSSIDDLLTGEVPLPTYLNAQKIVDDATDEVDSYLGHLYVTPLDLSDTSLIERHSRLLIKRVANFLASGRLLMSVAAPAEDNAVHAYGYSLVKQACDALQSISDGMVHLEGAIKKEVFATSHGGPLVGQEDAESSVAAFYSRVANPRYRRGSVGTVWPARWDPSQGIVSE